jgi:hypothetical protein
MPRDGACPALGHALSLRCPGAKLALVLVVMNVVSSQDASTATLGPDNALTLTVRVR